MPIQYPTTPRPLEPLPEREQFYLKAIDRMDGFARSEGFTCWIYGGLAVEAYDGGRITREHDNVNVAVEKEDLLAMEEVLEELGLVVEEIGDTVEVDGGVKRGRAGFTNLEATQNPDREIYVIGLKPVKMNGEIISYMFHDPRYFAKSVTIGIAHFAEEFRVMLEGVEFSTFSPEAIHLSKRFGTFDAGNSLSEKTGKAYLHLMDIERMKPHIDESKRERLDASILIR